MQQISAALIIKLWKKVFTVSKKSVHLAYSFTKLCKACRTVHEHLQQSPREISILLGNKQQ